VGKRGALITVGLCRRTLPTTRGARPPGFRPLRPSEVSHIIRWYRCTLPRSVIPLWACGLVQSSVRPAGIGPIGLPDSTSPLPASGPRPCGLSIRPSQVDGLESAHAPLVEFRRPLGSCADEASRSPAGVSLSLGLFSRMALAATEVRLTRAKPSPSTFRPQGLVTLSTAYSLGCLVSLVSDRQRLSGSPFGAFSSQKVQRALPACHAPLAVAA